MKKPLLLLTILVLSCGFTLTSSLRAQDQPDAPPPAEPQGPPQVDPQAQPQAESQAPPSSGPQGQPQAQPQPQTTVARISVVHGQVSTMRGDGGQWQAGTVNAPLVPGDSIATAAGGRTEVQLDYANIMRLDQNSEAKVTDLEQNKIQIQFGSGAMDYTVLKGTQADVEIDTPNMGVHPLSPGVYRIQVTSPTETSLIVREGEAEVLTNQGSAKVEPGQIIQIHGADNPEYKIDPAPGRDEFDSWCRSRDHQVQNAQAWQHTDQYYTGASDLDNNGQWGQVPDYGWCWTPQVDAGWVPYSAGYWGYEPYWGWTWISSEPWGWAPYHYGRWFMYGGAWRWWPGMGFWGARPIWAPAYVSFFGFGHGFGIGLGFGFGSIGWLALGPRDIFHAWYGIGHGFAALGFDAVHGAGFIRPGGPRFGSNLETMRTDAHVRAALRNVSAQEFGSGRMGRSSPVGEGMLRSASMMRGSLPVSPSRGSFGRAASYRPAASSQHFSLRGAATSAGRAGGYSGAGSSARPNTMAGRGSQGSQGWQRYAGGNSAARPNTGFRGGSAAAPQGMQHNWDRFASPNPYSGRAGAGGASERGGWQGYSNQSRGYSGGARGGSYGGGWNGAAPRTGGYYNGGGSRAPMNLNRPIMGQRAPNGGRGYSGGSRGYSAPRGGSSAPRSSGGGGGHSYSGGGGHSSGGGHSGGGGGHSGGGGHGRR